MVGSRDRVYNNRSRLHGYPLGDTMKKLGYSLAIVAVLFAVAAGELDPSGRTPLFGLYLLFMFAAMIVARNIEVKEKQAKQQAHDKRLEEQFKQRYGVK
jgi:hypothetical protein